MIVILGILLVRYPAEYATHDGSYTIVITSENQMDSARATFTFFSTNTSIHARLVLTVFLGFFTVVHSFGCIDGSL